MTVRTRGGNAQELDAREPSFFRAYAARVRIVGRN